MNNSQQILSDAVVFEKYAKYINSRGRREVFQEICSRYEEMMMEKYPELSGEIVRAMNFVRNKKVLPSMRGFQFAGPAIKKNNARIYNCAYLPIDSTTSFSEVMFLLLGGTGVGFSVQNHHVSKLPPIRKAFYKQKYLIQDSIEGWADAVKVLVEAYFGLRDTMPVFDYSDIREKGQRLVTAGGKAPGPEPLKRCIKHIKEILDNKIDGQQLKPIEVHDIVCHIANSVLAGGIRRSALISLFSADDNDMITAKSGAWWDDNPQRGRANNSAVFLRHKATKDFFMSFWQKIKDSNAGEPGIYFSNDKDLGTNPCAEISLRPFQFCNLVEVNASMIKTQEDLNSAVKAATFLGTLQAGFTNFHYLRRQWVETTEKDALVGVGITGIASGTLKHLDLRLASGVAIAENERVADVIGINPAARLLTVKPSGTTSTVLGTSSGIHAWHSRFYIRRMQMDKSSELYKYLHSQVPELVPDYEAIPNSAVLEIPQKAPDTGICRDDETAIEFLERVKRYNLEWVREGHRDGANTNNVSATVSIKEDEWDVVADWMWDNRNYYNGLSVLPYDNGSYVQAPFEVITEEEYERRMSLAKSLNFANILEEQDNTDLSGEVACSGGKCEVL